MDDPPATITITSINPDDSEPTNCPDANSTLNTTSISYICMLMYKKQTNSY